MSCPGCYKKGDERFCPVCRKKLFDGEKLPVHLVFDTPKGENLSHFQEKTKRLSISGVQLKYSLRLEDGTLQLTDRNGGYLLKPVPPAAQLAMVDQAPENEHLTMQIAEQVFNIRTAANALMRFQDGAPAYVTRRFDVQAGTDVRYQQEDFAQLSGRTKKSYGENFKYDGSYEEIGLLIKKYVAAYLPALEEFFTQVFFNYLFSNGDEHMKNFSLTRTPFGDYRLTPAYDLMCTVLHTEGESDTALDLYKGDTEDAFYQSQGYYGRTHFEELARRIGLLPRRAMAIIDRLLQQEEKIRGMVEQSFLSRKAKEKYLFYYRDKVKRFTNA